MALERQVCQSLFRYFITARFLNGREPPSAFCNWSRLFNLPKSPLHWIKIRPRICSLVCFPLNKIFLKYFLRMHIYIKNSYMSEFIYLLCTFFREGTEGFFMRFRKLSSRLPENNCRRVVRRFAFKWFLDDGFLEEIWKMFQRTLRVNEKGFQSASNKLKAS